MAAWGESGRERLLADVSLWSADLARLGQEVQRLSGYADSFHLDVADAHFAPGLLFFPEMLRALRRHTEVPFHAHLMVERPAELAREFVAAGAALVTVHVEATEAGRAIQAVRRAGRQAGLALRIETPVEAAAPYLEDLDALLLLGTAVGVKGQEPSHEAYTRLAQAAGQIRARRARALLIADGGIRRHTVPRLRQAGADAVVPGSLVFGSADLEATFGWLRTTEPV